MVAKVLLLSSAVMGSGRSFSLRRGSSPWEGSTDFMDQYSADAEKSFHQNGRAAQEMDALDAKQASSEPWEDVHVSEKQSTEPSGAAPASVSDAWLKQSQDSWAFVPHAKALDDAPADSLDEPHIDASSDRLDDHVEEHANHADTFELSPGTADFWKPSGAMDWDTELRSAQKQTSDAWGMAPHKQSTETWEMAPRAAVRQATEAEFPAPSDAPRAFHISSDVSSSDWGTHLSSGSSSDASSDATNDASSDVSRDTSGKESSDGAAVKTRAGSLGGLFDGGEDRGRHGHKSEKGAGESSAQAPPAPNHAGGEVVDVRLDSELQEAIRDR